MFSWELADEKNKIDYFCYDYVHISLLSSSWKTFATILLFILTSPIPSSSLAPPSYTFAFRFSVLKLSLQTVSTFRSAFLILSVILIYHCFPGKYLLALIRARQKFENSFLLCLTFSLVNGKQLFLYLSGCLGECWLACVIHLMTSCLTDQY